MLQRRAGLSAAAVRDAGSALAEALLPVCGPAGTVAAHASFGTEPPTGPLLDALSGVRLLLPVLLPDGDLDWAEHVAGSPLVPGRHGLLEPGGPRLGVEAVAGCDVVLVPALAVDRAGVRLGRGGGAYDRALARARGRTVALLHDGELVDHLPAEPHDVAVSAVVTPTTGVLVTPPGTPPAR